MRYGFWSVPSRCQVTLLEIEFQCVSVLSKKQSVAWRSLITCRSSVRLWSTVHLLCATRGRAGEVKYAAQDSGSGRGKSSVRCIRRSQRERVTSPSSDRFGAECLLLEHLSPPPDTSDLFTGLQDQSGGAFLLPAAGSSRALVCLLCPEKSQWSV